VEELVSGKLLGDDLNVIAANIFARYILKLIDLKVKKTEVMTADMFTALGLEPIPGKVRRIGRGLGFGHLALQRCLNTHFYSINDYNINIIMSTLVNNGQHDLANKIRTYLK
jgi:hypothetical protein